MSIVPYNPNNDILYHNPNDGILILHDTEENSIQLLSTEEEDGPQFRTRSGSNEFDPKRFPSFGEKADSIRCPSCGFTWDQFETRNSRRKSSVGAQAIPSATKIKDFISSYTKPYMRTDYFKLLSQIPYSKEGEGKRTSTKGIPSGIFNQGYFQKFFRKVGRNPLGSGARAQVYKVEHVFNDIVLGTFAVKRISVGDKLQQLEQVLNEVLILYELSAKSDGENNLIRYNHVWLELGDLEDSSSYFLSADPSDPKGSQKVPYMFILQQYCDGGHLEGIIEENFPLEESMSYADKVKLEKKRRKLQKLGKEQEEEHAWLSNFEIWKFFHDIANGVNYLHKNGILHRDLKPSNCLAESRYHPTELPQIFETIESFEEKVFELPRILVSDFGEGKFTDKHKNTGLRNVSNREGNTGTLEFTAPELWVCSNDSRFINEFSYESDVYSLGLILCYLCLGTLPFADLIKGEVDPDVSRRKIQSWYTSLSYETFGAWFEDTLNRRKRAMDNCMSDFKLLIYDMIKGDTQDNTGDIIRMSTKDVLVFLNDIKWKRFIEATSEEKVKRPGSKLSNTEELALYQPGHPRNQSIRESSDAEEEEEEDLEYEKENETDHLNLTEEEFEPQPMPLLDYKLKSARNTSTLPRSATLPLYSVELLLLEYLSLYSPHFSQTVLKVAIYVTITLDLILEKYTTIRSSLLALTFISLCVVLVYTIGGGHT
ncbi:IKS1 [Candida theae]|uniref:IKS1 n=1 Tax=Candida theae TaxID=1198502 RepID=A0AAD5BCS7_9ASCO|nr:IKS1 [Candida theae]KAI5954785.1 IKS1 [Candida theae]